MSEYLITKETLEQFGKELGEEFSKTAIDVIKMTWNSAIESALKDLEEYCRAQKNNQDETTVAYSIDRIRKLKL